MIIHLLLTVCLFVITHCLSVCLCVCYYSLSVCLSVCLLLLTVCLFVNLLLTVWWCVTTHCTCLFVCVFVCHYSLSVCLPLLTVCLFVITHCLSVCLCVCYYPLSVCLSVCLLLHEAAFIHWTWVSLTLTTGYSYEVDLAMVFISTAGTIRVIQCCRVGCLFSCSCLPTLVCFFSLSFWWARFAKALECLCRLSFLLTLCLHCRSLAAGLVWTEHEK
jgi:hypothetical protein